MAHPKEDWPTTVEQAVDRLLSSMSVEDRFTLANMPEERFPSLHLGLGAPARGGLVVRCRLDPG